MKICSDSIINAILPVNNEPMILITNDMNTKKNESIIMRFLLFMTLNIRFKYKYFLLI